MLDKENPTLSRLGRNSVLLVSANTRWKLFGADVNSAFLQADEVTPMTTNYVVPTSGMRRICGLTEDEYLHLTKFMFGDCRAPRFWSDKLFAVLKNTGFRQHPLDMRVWMSYDGAGKLDGILGVHADDWIVCGKQDSSFVE